VHAAVVNILALIDGGKMSSGFALCLEGGLAFACSIAGITGVNSFLSIIFQS
jgi:hypothetical protein